MVNVPLLFIHHNLHPALCTYRDACHLCERRFSRTRRLSIVSISLPVFVQLSKVLYSGCSIGCHCCFLFNSLCIVRTRFATGPHFVRHESSSRIHYIFESHNSQSLDNDMHVLPDLHFPRFKVLPRTSRPQKVFVAIAHLRPAIQSARPARWHDATCNIAESPSRRAGLGLLQACDCALLLISDRCTSKCRSTGHIFAS